MTERRHAFFASAFEGTAAVTASTPPIELCSGLIRIHAQVQFGAGIFSAFRLLRTFTNFVPASMTEAAYHTAARNRHRRWRYR